jgi:hypothetical protein
MKAIVSFATLLCCATLTGAAGEFANLTFDDPDLSHARLFLLPTDDRAHWYAPVEEAFRGWTVSGPLNWTPTEGMVCLEGGSPLGLKWAGGEPPFGAYIVGVSAIYPWRAVRPEFSLAQVGKVPEETSALFFYEVDGGGEPPLFPEPIHVLVNGVQQAVIASPYGCPMVDFSAFAGQEVELKFVFPAGDSEAEFNCSGCYQFDIFGFGPLPGAPTPVIIRQIIATGGQVILGWTGPSPRYQVQQKAALDQPWENLGAPLMQTNWTNAVTAPLGFFRVVGLPE